MNKILASAIAATVLVPALALAGGGGTNSEVLYNFGDLQCRGANGRLTPATSSTVDLGEAGVMALAEFTYDIFDHDFKFFAHADDCYVIQPIKFDPTGLLVSGGAPIGSECRLKTGLGLGGFIGYIFNYTQLVQNDADVYITSNLIDPTLCPEEKSHVVMHYVRNF